MTDLAVERELWRLRTPRAAAVTGIMFSLLMIVSVVLIRLSVPADPLETGDWLSTRKNLVVLALYLVPFSGIAFLWFIGVVRDRLGVREDRLFSSVFLGSGLLFLAMLFASSAMFGGLILVHEATPDRPMTSETYTSVRAISYLMMNVYSMRMAGVFMISACTIATRTKIFPQWIAVLGYGLALALLLVVGSSHWIVLVFPSWVLLVSIYILIENHRGGAESAVPQSANM